ncbi:MAG: GDP-mannose 4,6-dehydratase [Bacteroidales bacterium]|nr:GDP-mannose 4,6-dehydratase [Bacteroidales bacterium]
MTKKNILITGGAGFIGSHLTDKLLSFGHEVVCMDNFDNFYCKTIKVHNMDKAITNKKFHLLERDICDKKQLDHCFRSFPIDIVIHLAAKAGVRPSIADPHGYYLTNVLGTLNLLEAMKIHGVTKMIFASSSSVYGNNPNVPFSETDFVDNPISPYASSKKAAELLCHTYHHLYAFDIFCLRFFTVYGPRQRPDLAIHKFTEMILSDQPIPVFGDGSSSRDYTYIDDIVDGLVKAADRVKGYEIINLGESRTVSLNRMIETIENEIGKKAKKVEYPMQPGDVVTTFADISKAKLLLDYSPYWNFEDGIKKFIEWKTS